MHRDLRLADRLRLLARHLAVLQRPGFSFGTWVRARERADGVLVIGWYEPSPEAEAFLADVRAGGWVAPFDWPTWASSDEGRRLLGDREAVAAATPEDLRRLLTTYVRAERFGDGTLESAYASGMLTAIVRRAAVLAKTAERDG